MEKVYHGITVILSFCFFTFFYGFKILQTGEFLPFSERHAAPISIVLEI